MRSPKKEATIEEIDINQTPELNNDEREDNKPLVIKELGRLDTSSRSNDITKVLGYNILKRQENDDIQTWKSYPGVGEIVRISRNIVENNDTKDIGKLAWMMQAHESQQSATIICTIAILVGSKLNNNVDTVVREAIGDVILWDIPVIKEKKDWPQRKKYTPNIIYDNEEDMKDTKLIVHGYLGHKARKEMEQFHTEGELRRIAHYEDGVWIAPTRSTFKSYIHPRCVP